MSEESITFTVEDVEHALNDVSFLAQKLSIPLDHPKLHEAQAFLRNFLAKNPQAKTKSHSDVLLDAIEVVWLFLPLNIFPNRPEKVLLETLQSWLKISNYREERHFLEKHIELLEPRSISLVERLIQLTTQYSFKDLAQLLKRYLNLLLDVLQRGGTLQAIREAYVNIHGGLVLDIPLWIERMEQQINDLLDDGRRHGIHQIYVRLLSTAVDRADKEPDIAQETRVELIILLQDALREYSNVQKYHMQNETTEQIDKVLQVYTRKRYPLQYAKTLQLLGVIYTQHMTDRRQSKKLEEAINCYREASFIFKDTDSQANYARTLFNLGTTYCELPTGNRLANLSEAISCYEDALSIFTHDQFPIDYAQTLLNLGATYSELLVGNRVDNLEKAIEYYQLALGVFKRDELSPYYARTLLNLGRAYSQRIKGERRANIEKAIEYYNDALKVFTPEDFPVDYAQTHLSLGAAYSERLTGDRSLNLELAIDAYKRALEILTLERFSEDYARIQLNLGTIFSQRTSGEVGANLEEAIACYEHALEIFTNQDFRLEHAVVLYNLGNTYTRRYAGTQRANQKKSIDYYERALKIFTCERFPDECAAIQNNLGNIYVKRKDEEQGENLEIAIRYYQSALETYTANDYPLDHARTQSNLGKAYMKRVEGEKQENIQSAVECFEKALNIFTLEEYPVHYRHIQLSRALAEASQRHWEAVRDAYSKAAKVERFLIAFTVDVARRKAILVEGSDAAVCEGFALARLSRLPEAILAFERACSRRLMDAMILDTTDTHRVADPDRQDRFEDARKHFVAAQEALNTPLKLGIDSDIQDPNLVKQIRRTAERERLIAYQQAKQEFETVIDEIRKAQDPSNFLEMKIEPNTIFRRIGQVESKHAFVYLAATPWGGVAIAAIPTTDFDAGTAMPHFKLLDLPNLQCDRVAELIESNLVHDEVNLIIGGFAHAQRRDGIALLRQWPGKSFSEQAKALQDAIERTKKSSLLNRAAQALLTNPASKDIADQWIEQLSRSERDQFSDELNFSFLQHELNQCCKVLAQSVIQPLTDWLVQYDVTQVTLIPCGQLALLPLATVEVRPGKTMNDIIPTSVAPSALSYLYDQSSHHLRSTVYALGDPRPSSHSLRWSELQAHTVVTLARHLKLQAKVAVHYNATRQLMLKALQEGLIVAISTHWVLSFNESTQLALMLAKQEKLTAKDVLASRLNLQGLPLLILSLCKEEILDPRMAHDEGLNFAIAMLQAGVKSIFTSLWAVDDRASYLLTVRFLQEWLPHMDKMSPAVALGKAQIWLRSVTNRELSTWDVSGDKADLFESDLQDFEEPEDYSLEHNLLGADLWNDLNYDTNVAQSIIRRGAAQSSDLDEIPYKDPVYWAGFQIMGR
jgi:tetratricopeptide (TPR) repeat protein